MIPINLGDDLQVLNLQTNASITTDGNGTGVDLNDYEGEIAIVSDVSAPVAGSSPTMDLKIQESSDNSTYTDVTGGAFTQVTSAAASEKISLNKNNLKRYIRLVKDIGGTSSPQYYVSVKAYALKRVK